MCDDHNPWFHIQWNLCIKAIVAFFLTVYIGKGYILKRTQFFWITKVPSNPEGFCTEREDGHYFYPMSFNSEKEKQLFL